MKTYTLDDFAQLIDHTNSHADANDQAMAQLCQEAKDHHFRMVAINQVQSRRCAGYLKGTDVHVGAAIAFPLGQTSIASKCFETQDAIDNGATEIDYVANLTEVKEHNWDYIREEMEKIVTICKKHGIPSKVIFETCYLTKEEIIEMAKIAKEVQPTFIKTSTGFGTAGATVENVRLMKETVGDAVKVTAAGGIRDANTFLAMIQAGAERIGTSSGVKIIKELEVRMDGKESMEV
jgi:deoxyribose-phosphate aldolase